MVEKGARVGGHANQNAEAPRSYSEHRHLGLRPRRHSYVLSTQWTTKKRDILFL